LATLVRAGYPNWGLDLGSRPKAEVLAQRWACLMLRVDLPFWRGGRDQTPRAL